MIEYIWPFFIIFFIFFVSNTACINPFVVYKMAVLPEINRLNFFKELPFCNKPIEKPRIRRLTNINLLAELPFYKQPSIIKVNHAFKGHAMSYKVEIVEGKDLILQLETCKSSIKDLFSNLLNEIKSFKNQITVKVLLKIQAQ